MTLQHTWTGDGGAEVSPEARYICCYPAFEPPAELEMRRMPNPKGDQRYEPTKGTRKHVTVHAAQVWKIVETCRYLKDKDRLSGVAWPMWQKWDVWVHVAKAAGYSQAVGSDALDGWDENKYAHWSQKDSSDLRCASEGHMWGKFVMHACQRPLLQVH